MIRLGDSSEDESESDDDTSTQEGLDSFFGGLHTFIKEARCALCLDLFGCLLIDRK